MSGSSDRRFCNFRALQAGNTRLPSGTEIGPAQCVTIRHYRDFDAWQLAAEFQQKVFAILRASPSAARDFEFRGQLVESARAPTKHIAECFLRKSPRYFINFLDYAIGSLGEAEEHLDDGVHLGYFEQGAVQEAIRLSRRARLACLALKRSQERYLERTSSGRSRPNRTAKRQ